MCLANAEVDYGCPWGAGCGADVGQQTRDRYCSGASASCNGNLGGWKGNWSVADACSSIETCADNDSICNAASSCCGNNGQPCCSGNTCNSGSLTCFGGTCQICECSSGTCCNGCHYAAIEARCGRHAWAQEGGSGQATRRATGLQNAQASQDGLPCGCRAAMAVWSPTATASATASLRFTQQHE